MQQINANRLLYKAWFGVKSDSLQIEQEIEIWP